MIAALILLLAGPVGNATVPPPAADVTLRWAPPTSGRERITAYRVRLASVDRREILTAEVRSLMATGVTLSTRMSGAAVACVWTLGFRGEPSVPSCRDVHLPRGDRPDRAATTVVDLGGVASPIRDDRYQVRWPNVPHDFMLLARNDFTEPDGAPWKLTRRLGRFESIQDSMAPDSPPGVGRAVFDAGFSGDGAEPFALGHEPFADLAIRDLYIAFWLRVSDNWRSHSSGVNKILHIWNADAPTERSSNIVYFALFGRGGEPLEVQPRVQTAGFNRNLQPNLERGTVARGRWVLVELLLIGARGADGQAHVWLTPPGGRSVKVLDHRDVNFFGTDARADLWRLVHWAPTWGGRGDTAIRAPQTMDIDGIVIMGR